MKKTDTWTPGRRILDFGLRILDWNFLQNPKSKIQNGLRLCLLAILMLVAAPLTAHAANPTLQDISRSFENRLNQKPGSGSYTAIILGIVAVVGILILASQWGRRREKPRVSNHPGRLLREMRRKIHLSNPQVKRLKAFADRKGCASPLTVILCPSLLEKKTANPPTQNTSSP